MAKGEFPKKYKHIEVEQKWIDQWEESGIFKWDSSQPRSNTFVVDTPPPTVSGSLHVGHAFSYTQTDLVVRFQRMMGKNIFYPMGWDDNGLPTERRVQNYFGIRCEPHLKYDPDWKPNHEFNPKKDDKVEISRQNFIEACEELTHEDEKAFEQMWRRQGLSVDWSLTYATIDDDSRRASQLSFLDLIDKNEAYSAVSPTMWDVDFRTAVAQAELEDRERPGAYHDIRFEIEGGGDFTISTTRPELLCACIAVVAHPDDERYQDLFGKTAITPLFHAPVPIRAAEHADPEKGTGILMVCTFGDIMDVDWWKQSDLPVKQVVGLNGRLVEATFGEEPFASVNPEIANKNYGEIVGLTIKQAQKKTVELLSEDGSLIGDPEPITHPVKFYEKGDRPLEFVPTRQWFIRVLDHKEELVAQGEKIKWYPEFMRTRYEHWVQGLNQDWCISRQRYFGVPFPVWYPVQEDGEVDYDSPIFSSKESLPIDPLSDTAPGFTEEQRDQPGGFTGDSNVMDTWATSAMTPQIMSKWGVDEKRHSELFPMDIRPQGHDIIRTWAFGTIVKAWMHHDDVPWKHILLSGWILDPDRKKMSKSKGNVVTPEGMLNEFSADGVRYWAARARLGVDTAFDESLFKIGNKLVTKIFNASRFVVSQLERVGIDPGDIQVDQITEELDLALVDKVRALIAKGTEDFEKFEYANVLQETEELFWTFCDHYLELVKVRSYGDEESAGRTSALMTLGWSLKTFLRMFAPFLPYVTEEVWSCSFTGEGREEHVHSSAWPTVEEIANVSKPASAESFAAAVEVIGKIRGAKTDAQKSLKWEVSQLEIGCTGAAKEALQTVLEDVRAGGNVTACEFVEVGSSEEFEGAFDVKVTLAVE